MEPENSENQSYVDQYLEEMFQDEIRKLDQGMSLQHQLNEENREFLVENQMSVSVNPYKPALSVDFLVDVNSEEVFIKSLLPTENAVWLSEASGGTVNAANGIINEDGSNTCAGNFASTFENKVSHKPYDLQTVINSACASVPTGGNSAYSAGMLKYNLGSFNKDGDIHLIFKYLHGYAFEWDMNASRTPSILFRTFMRLKVVEVEVSTGSTRLLVNTIFEKHEIPRQMITGQYKGNKMQKPLSKTKAEKVTVKKSDATKKYEYIATIESSIYTWPVDGNAFCKQIFHLIPYS